MTEENKQEKAETKEESTPRGPKGELGEATPAKAVKLLWHEEHFILQNVGDKHNPRRQAWVRKAGAPSLKRYAKQLASAGNQVAKDWFANKDGLLNEERSDKNKTRISLEKAATKQAKRKKSQGKQGKPAATTDATAASADKGKKK